MRERTCERCGGREFRAFGTVERDTHPLAAQRREYWFCARCDWGRLAREEQRS